VTRDSASVRRSFRLILAAVTTASVLSAAVLGWTLWETRRRRPGVPEGDVANFVRHGDDWISTSPNMNCPPFPVLKPAGEFRVFVLGSSAAQGVPYVISRRRGVLGQGGIPTWLRHYLQALFPERSVRVVNAAKNGGDLREVLRVFREVATLGEPDLVVILEGNNERSELNSRWGLDEGYPDIPAAVAGTAERLTGRFRRDAKACVRLAEERGIDLMFLTVPVNLRDWLPATAGDFKPRPALRLLKAGKAAEALALLDGEPLADDPLWLFCRAKSLDALGRSDEATPLYHRARDLDAIFLRCRSAWNDEVRRLRGKTLRVFDLESDVARRAPEGLPGFDFFLDFCHLRLEENQRAALSVARDYGEWKGRPDADLRRLEDVELPEFLGRWRIAIHSLKVVQWLRMGYFSHSSFVRWTNTRAVVASYLRRMKKLDEHERSVRPFERGEYLPGLPPTRVERPAGGDR
jgi:hypothetical protein